MSLRINSLVFSEYASQSEEVIYWLLYCSKHNLHMLICSLNSITTDDHVRSLTTVTVFSTEDFSQKRMVFDDQPSNKVFNSETSDTVILRVCLLGIFSTRNKSLKKTWTSRSPCAAPRRRRLRRFIGGLTANYYCAGKLTGNGERLSRYYYRFLTSAESEYDGEKSVTSSWPCAKFKKKTKKFWLLNAITQPSRWPTFISEAFIGRRAFARAFTSFRLFLSNA